jgi:hypothetical protein
MFAADRPTTVRALIALRAAVPPMPSHARDIADLTALIDAVASDVPPIREAVVDELERLVRPGALEGEVAEAARRLAEYVRRPWRAE